MWRTSGDKWSFCRGIRPRASGPWRHVCWDARTLGDWHRELNGAAGLVNLVGRSVDCIKTPEHQDEILRSRVEATRLLGQAMRLLDAPPPVWVQMSTAHIYGDPQEVICTEDSPPGYGFAPFVGRAWEEAFQESAVTRTAKSDLPHELRHRPQSRRRAAALARLRKLRRLGLGGTVGSGRQGVSWIHEADMNRLFERALTDSNMQGVYIATAPNPVSQREFMRELRRAIHMPIGLPTASWMVRLGAPLLLRTDPELALYGRYLISQRLRELGFEFRFPNLRDALADLHRN